MPENQVVGVLVKRNGRTWRVQVQKQLFGDFVQVATVADGLKLADARAEAERVAGEHGVQVREVK